MFALLPTHTHHPKGHLAAVALGLGHTRPVISPSVINPQVSVSPPISAPSSPESKTNNKRSCPPAPKKVRDAPPAKTIRCSYTGYTGSLPPRDVDPKCSDCSRSITRGAPCKHCLAEDTPYPSANG